MTHAIVSPMRRYALCTTLAAFAVMLMTCSANSAQEKAAGAKTLRFFVSGHSLTDDPLGGYVAGIAQSKGFETDWDEQIVIGSPVRARTLGLENDFTNWKGYATGKDRHGKDNRSVLDRFAARKAAGKPFDALILTEGHKSLLTLRWNQPDRYARHFRDRFVAANPNGITYYYHPWESVRDATKLKDWIANERRSSQMWSCVSERINVSLALEKQKDKVVPLPVGYGLTHLLEGILEGKLPGHSPENDAAAAKLLFSDNVHLTKLGVYFAALTTFIGVTGENPEGGWKPDFLTPEAAAFLQQTAWGAYEEWKRTPRPTTMADCRAAAVAFCPAYNAYVPDEWSGPVDGCEEFFSRDTPSRAGEEGNPFAFDAAKDQANWYGYPPAAGAP